MVGSVINICVPVLRRYDLLQLMLRSLQKSNTPINKIWVINNGRDDVRLQKAILDAPAETLVHTPKENLGVAASWNWFIRNVPEERIITNDDIAFGPQSVEKIVGTPGDLVWAGFGFSCYLIRDECVKKIGYFDEEISPGYGYYEDEDYLQRLDGKGTREPSARAVNVNADLCHVHSATLQAASHTETMDHHRKFLIAQKNYAKKWGVSF